MVAHPSLPRAAARPPREPSGSWQRSPSAVALAALLAALLAAAAPLAAQAQQREEILAYDVAVDIRDGGRMDVTEEITVRAQGNRIKRGIYRDFPTSFPRSSGLGRIVAPFEVHEVLRDGRKEPYALESIGGPVGRSGMRVRIGNADVLLKPGTYTYTIRYETWRWVVFGEDHDALYWNVTGNGWSFPIEEASARVSLPRDVDPDSLGMEVWTGAEGSTASRAAARWDAGDRAAEFATTAPLGAREGMTFRLTFPRGVVAPPSDEVRKAWFRMDWGGYIDATTLLGLVLALYILMWSRVGRDPARGPTVVRYEPPPGFSPAALGFLRERGYDQALLASALVSMAVKGALRIEKEGHTWTLERVGDEPPDTLAPEERGLWQDLLAHRRTLELKPTHAATLKAAVRNLRRTLGRQLEREYFLLHRRWFFAGLAVSAVGFAFLVWRDRYGIAPEAWFFSVWISFWTLGVATLVIRALKAWALALHGGGFGSWVEALFLSLFSLPFVGAEVAVGTLMASRVPTHLMLAAVSLALVNVLFYHLLERPTLKGRGVLDQLDGFRTFLSATDADRLNRLNPPDRTPELFERFLPHAMALGVESRWARRFEDVLTPEVRRGGSGAGSLAWYAGGSGADLSGIASSLGGAFSSSLSAASSPPSSGGSGGGGSSGGGGGGGGGGGW